MVERYEFEFFASCLPGIEQLLADELKTLGIQRVRPLGGGVVFFGDAIDGERICLWSRLAARVLLVVGRIGASDADELYAGAHNIAWERVVGLSASVAVRAHGTNAQLRNSQFAALKVKDALCDRLREVRGKRPNVDPRNPDCMIDLRIRGNRATVSLDLAGESLYRRSYLEADRADDEALFCAHAAATLAALNWRDRFSQGWGLFDPACASACLVVEAAATAADLAPGLLRDRWGFLGWAKHKPDAWGDLLDDADERLEQGIAACLAKHGEGLAAAHNAAIGLETGVPRDASATEARPSSQAPDTATVRIVGVSSSSPAISKARGYLKRVGLRRVASIEAASSDDAPIVLDRLSRIVASHDGSLAVASVLPIDHDAADARAVSEMSAFLAACKAAPEGSAFALLSSEGSSARYGAPPASSLQVGRGRVEAVLETFDKPPATMHVLPIADPEGGADHFVEVHDPQAEQFATRLRKVAKERRKWARKQGVTCYRVYDADLPDYSLAIDLYEGAQAAEGKRFVHVAEYQAPSSIDANVAVRRFEDALSIVPVVLGVRPDHVFSKVRERSKGGGQYRNVGRRSYVSHTRESGFIFEIDLAAYLDTGIFLDHRLTREMLGDMAKGKRFLNLFAYTGTATVHAAAGGALSTKTVDLSQTYLDWARRNMELNGFNGSEHEYVRDDAMSWIGNARKERERYDLIFVDPPTFSNSKAMGKRTWDVQRDHAELLIGVSRLLARDGVAVFSCNLRTFKPDTEKLERYGVKLEDITEQTIPYDFERNGRIHKCYLVSRTTQA